MGALELNVKGRQIIKKNSERNSKSNQAGQLLLVEKEEEKKVNIIK